MNGINLVAVFAAAASAFVLGGLWYSPALFAASWMRYAGLSETQIRSGNRALIFGGAFVLSLIAAFVFAMFLGPAPALGFALGAGSSAGLCWVAASLGINYLFERRPFKLFLINGSYFTLQFTLYGLVLGLWH
ncbi:MAG TPA: DUF1761 domain-containing protein [Steroidobacteraceae bacterium]|nr:DUF1761 domain-containing protein [Steroidobacteraceae bacterium]